MKTLNLLSIGLTFLLSANAFASCQILNSKKEVVESLSDALSVVFAKQQKCPQNVQELKFLLVSQGYKTRHTMVANRGIHNPTLGSFSFFEEVIGKDLIEGQFFFGHFTGVANGVLSLEQAPARGSLMVELIAWDPKKQFFNFYELIGMGAGAQWFYRGDSADILLDNEMLFRNKVGSAPQFGTRLRCSGCHGSGGPIMKELAFPFNDWWTAAKPLEFGALKFSNEVQALVSKILPADRFSTSVKSGILQLQESSEFQKLKSGKSRQEILRPLFCETEINLESDLHPLSDGQASTIAIPSRFLINPLLASAFLAIPKQEYLSTMLKNRMRFPETNELDADHPWLTPVKGTSNLLEIEALKRNSEYGEDFIESVLMVDLQTPLFSQKRCGLLKLLPEGGRSNDWKMFFLTNLKNSNLEGAKELLEIFSLSLNERKLKIQETVSQLQNQTDFNSLFNKLLKKRAEVFESDISKNPKGQILEPGFRVIFPMPN